MRQNFQPVGPYSTLCFHASRLQQQPHYSGSVQSDTDRYSYAASDDSGQDEGSQEEAMSEPLFGNERYKKLQDLNRSVSVHDNRHTTCLSHIPPLGRMQRQGRRRPDWGTGLSCRGASGFVQLALNTQTNEQVAIKFLERGGGSSQRVIARELLNHRECALHPNIVQLKVPSSKRVWLLAALLRRCVSLAGHLDNHGRSGSVTLVRLATPCPPLTNLM